MKDDHIRSDADTAGRDQDPLLVEDLIRYLVRLSKIHADERIGNQDLAKALSQLVQGLKTHSDLQTTDLSSVLAGKSPVKRARRPKKDPVVRLPTNVENLSTHAVEDVLNNDQYTKAQLVQVGVRRFGVSNSRLMRLNRDRVVETIRAALNHEKSLGVISEEARRGGEKRSS